MSLAADLLKNPKKTLPPSVVPEAAPVEESPLTEAKKVRDRIFEGAQNMKSVILSGQEAAALRQFIETLEADPFANNSAVLDTLDMAKLDLEVDNSPAQGDEDEDPFHNGSPDEDAAKPKPATVGTDRIPVDTAVVAPDATPYHDEPIPSSVLASLQALQSQDREQPVDLSAAPAPVAPQAPPARPASPGGPTVNGMPIGQTRQNAAPAPAAQPSSIPAESRHTAHNAPILSEENVPIKQIMGNWRRAFKATQSE